MSESINGKKVFVTGADGFIGSHLVELLASSGAAVRGLVYYNSWNEPDLFMGNTVQIGVYTKGLL